MLAREDGRQSLTDQARNGTLDDASDETTRISTIRKDLGEKRYRRLLAANELDIRLYDYVKSRFSIGT